jgi:hypothetical protein
MAPGAPVTLLHIGASETIAASGTASEPEASLLLRVGYKQIAGKCFRHNPPTPYELGGAINLTEDEVVRTQPILA